MMRETIHELDLADRIRKSRREYIREKGMRDPVLNEAAEGCRNLKDYFKEEMKHDRRR